MNPVAPIAIERIAPGSPLSVAIHRHGRPSRCLTHHCATKPGSGYGTGVTEQQTTTTTTRPLYSRRKRSYQRAREHRKKPWKRQIEKHKDALDKANDTLDDDD